MFLNLKNKKIAETIASQQAKLTYHPKTHREDSQQRNSKEHKEIKSYRQYQNVMPKKQLGNTAVNTTQAANNSFANVNNHFKIKIKDSQDTSSLENLNKSQQKLDSFRMERVASAYRKIKKLDSSNNDGSYLIEQLQHSHQKNKKGTNKSHKVGTKKQLASNFSKNNLCATQADDSQSRIIQKINSTKGQLLFELLNHFAQLFSPSLPEMKNRSQSHQQFELKKSLDKNSKNMKKDKKKRSNQILIREEEQLHQEKQVTNIHKIATVFFGRLDKAKEKIQEMSNSKKFKYIESPSVSLFQKLYEDVEIFISNFYQTCLRQIQLQIRRCEETVSLIAQQQHQMKEKCVQLEHTLKKQKEKSKMLENLTLNFQQKSLYSTIFLNQLSYDFDLDSHLREKLFQEAKKNGLISQACQSEFLDLPHQKIGHRSGVELGTNSGNLYDNNDNCFIGLNLPNFEKGMPKRQGKE